MKETTTTIEQLRKQVIDFRDARDWEQFHNPKDLAIAMSIEASEVLELCRFAPVEEILQKYSGDNNSQFAQELADVFSYLLTLAHTMKIDLASALEAKIKINEQHYPVELAKGRAAKYTELQKLEG